jgi:hypothetical protein
MYVVLRKIALAAVFGVTIMAATATVPGAAEARWGGHWGGGHWGGGHWGHNHGGWGWGGFGWGLGSGLAIGLAAPYYGGYYGGYYPYYASGYGPYGYGDCYVTRHWVINRYGHRVLRRATVCD